ncbi:MAG: FTR1 family protein [Neisseriaceae bacterium]|nr:FTR1 family protein [Neisseriaceae bacterium]
MQHFLIALLIMLREGLEAALIVGIVAGFLKQAGKSHLMPKVWGGVALAVALCFGVGFVLLKTVGEIPQKQQELVGGIIGLIAVAMLSWMILWMNKAAKSMRQELHGSMQAALAKSASGWFLVSMAFLAVLREGLESVFFLFAVFTQRGALSNMSLGAVAGLAVAVVIGFLIYQGSIRINLSKFFRITGVFLIFVAAGLFAGSFRALHEGGVWNLWQQRLYEYSSAFDWSKVLDEDSPLGVMLGGFFGYVHQPTVSDAVLYFAYLLPVLAWFLLGSRKKVQAA